MGWIGKRVGDEKPPDQCADLQNGQEPHGAQKRLFAAFVPKDAGCGEPAQGPAQRHDAQQAPFGKAAFIGQGALLIEPHGKESGGAEGTNPDQNDIVAHKKSDPNKGVYRALKNEGGGGAIDPLGPLGAADIGGNHCALDRGGGPALVPH